MVLRCLGYPTKTDQEEPMFDLTRTTARTGRVAVAVLDEQLDAPTPMDGTTVRELVHHLLGLTVAFRDAAAKLDGPTTSTAPGTQTGPLPDRWRAELRDRLADLATAWEDPGAWQAMAKAGGVALPGATGRVTPRRTRSCRSSPPTPARPTAADVVTCSVRWSRSPTTPRSSTGSWGWPGETLDGRHPRGDDAEPA
jgi:hypothetical protein